MHDDNSFDDQYLSAADIHHLLEALDRFINRSEGAWRTVPQEELERWAPYRRLRARLQNRLGMRMWDDAVTWLDTLLREERSVALGHLRREVETALNEPAIKRSEIRRRMIVLIDELRAKRLYTPPRSNQVDIEDARKERQKEPYTADNWRRG